jgi:hypothetical protein
MQGVGESMKRQTKTIAVILLAVCFLMSMTAATVSASSPSTAKEVSTSSPSSDQATGGKSIGSSQNEANNFVLHGVGKNSDVSIIYSSTSFKGVPIFNYKDSRITRNFMGKQQIRSQKTEIGTMVTVTLRMTIDDGNTKLTLFVPAINLDGSPRNFNTIAIRTTSKNNIVGPSIIKGALQSYVVIYLKGTASHVKF